MTPDIDKAAPKGDGAPGDKIGSGNTVGLDPHVEEFARETIANMRDVIETMRCCLARAEEHFAELSKKLEQSEF